MADSSLIRSELAKLERLPPWGRPQGDDWDRLSNFVYRVKTLPGVERQARARAKAAGLAVDAFEAYVIRRWFNHHTHDEILRIFYDHPDVRPEEDRRHRTVDFHFRGLPFDLKISRFPQSYPGSIQDARQRPHHLALWQYKNQSKQGRYHLSNRLFIILHNETQPQFTWQLRRDFNTLQRLIKTFLDTPTLLGLTVTNQHTQERCRPWAGMIFHTK